MAPSVATLVSFSAGTLARFMARALASVTVLHVYFWFRRSQWGVFHSFIITM
jgi:hypothetical protein